MRSKTWMSISGALMVLATLAIAPVAGANSGANDTANDSEYDSGGRRDPFRSLMATDGDKGGFAVDELDLQGIWRAQSGMVAQLQGPNNVAYLVSVGDVVFGAKVIAITSNEIVFKQPVADPLSPKPYQEISKRLSPARN